MDVSDRRDDRFVQDLGRGLVREAGNQDAIMLLQRETEDPKPRSAVRIT
jgi:hypothetical protein